MTRVKKQVADSKRDPDSCVYYGIITYSILQTSILGTAQGKLHVDPHCQQCQRHEI